MAKKPFVYMYKSGLMKERVCRMCKSTFKLVPKNRLDSICTKCKNSRAQYWSRPGIAI